MYLSKDFWPIAVGALITTCVACILIIINCILTGNQLEEKVYPPPTMEGCFKGEVELNYFLQRNHNILSLSFQLSAR